MRLKNVYIVTLAIFAQTDIKIRRAVAVLGTFPYALPLHALVGIGHVWTDDEPMASLFAVIVGVPSLDGNILKS